MSHKQLLPSLALLTLTSLPLSALAADPSALGVCGADVQITAPGPKGPEASIEVVEKGDKPRVELRYDFSHLPPEKMLLSLSMKMAMQMQGMDLPGTPAIPLVMEIDVKPDCLTPKGDLRYSFVFGKIGLQENSGFDPSVGQAVQTELNKLTGMSGWSVVSTRGIEVASVILPPPGMAPEDPMMENLNESMSNVSSPFPDKAIGLGGSWTVSQTVVSPKMTLDQSTTYKLVELNEKSARVTLELTQSAPKQNLNLGAQGMGATATLDTLKTAGKGNMKVDFNRIVPTSELSTHTDSSMTITMGSMAQPMTMTMDMIVNIAPGLETEAPAK